jgi:arsenate reductase (glutaredoxin)
MKFYHNPRCSKSRKAKTFLEENKIPYDLILYLDTGISVQEIKDMLSKGLTIKDLLRVNEQEYRDFVKNKNLPENKIISLIVEYPKMLQRPVAVGKKRALVCRDEDALQEIKKLV